MRTALIDGDIIAYRIAAYLDSKFQTPTYPELYVEDLILGTLNEIEEALDSNSIKIYITGDTNFRTELYPNYKANRKNLPRPKYLNEIKHTLEFSFSAERSVNEEADDLLGINQTSNTIICTLDKDLKMIPGEHYNWVKKEHAIVTLEEGYHWFFTQMLTGDVVDNVPGVTGIGNKKAEKLLGQEMDPLKLFAIVKDIYYNVYKEDSEKLFNQYGGSLWIRRNPGEIFPHLTPWEG